jgi:hypothetical protein
MIDPKSYVLLTVVQPEEPFTRFYSDLEVYQDVVPKVCLRKVGCVVLYCVSDSRDADSLS